MIQPAHVIYGGAHLFRADTCYKLGVIARRSFAEHAPDPETLAGVLGLPPELAQRIYPRLEEKLRTAPVEDFRIDFEDGYGVRSNQEEDAAAEAAGEQAAAGAMPQFFGIRIKALSGATRDRGLRTLDLFLGRIGHRYPRTFVVTLPKVSSTQEVRALVGALDRHEPGIGIELMVETPQAVRSLRELVDAAEGRCVAAHFGAFDYTASLGITSASQSLLHPACDFARSMMQVQLADTGVWLCDGATNFLPLGDRAAVHRAWKAHYDAVRHALDHGFYQGWDLHPAQLPARFAAVFAFFLEGLEPASARLRNFIEQAERATQVGGVFDDAATGRGLVNFFERGLACGAIRKDELPQGFDPTG